MSNITIRESEETYKPRGNGMAGGKAPERSKAIAEIDIPDYTFYIFQGSFSPNDILIKYRGPHSRLKRTPKHIHWLIDLLLKKQGNERVTNEFLQKCQNYWNSEVHPLESNDFNALKNLVDSYLVKKDYFGIRGEAQSLKQYGEFPIEFEACLFLLLSTEEKTNLHSAYMFGNVVNELLKPMSELDISKAVSTAVYRG